MSRRRLPVLLFTAACMAACGKDAAPGPSVTPAATITITASGVNPSTVTVTRGSQVEFVNNDSRAHQMSSDPHPDHQDCPEINAVGFLSPGQRRQTGNLNTARNCGFHDHDRPNDAGLRGTIVIR